MKNIKGKNMRRTLGCCAGRSHAAANRWLQAATRTNLPAVILTTIIAELQR